MRRHTGCDRGQACVDNRTQWPSPARQAAKVRALFLPASLDSPDNHDMFAQGGPASFASVASASIWTPIMTTSPVLPSRDDDGQASNSPGANSTTSPVTTIKL